MKVHDLLDAAADRFPDKEAIIQGARRATYREVRRGMDAVAAALVREGVPTGARVSVIVENSAEYAAAYFGIMKAGAIAVPLSDQSTPRGIREVLRDCEASAVIVNRKKAGVLSEALPGLPSVRLVIVAEAGDLGTAGPPAEDGPSREAAGVPAIALRSLLAYRSGEGTTFPATGEGEVALILYTSGTTGSPKGVMLTHRNLVANAASIVEYLGLTDRDRVLAVLPFYYSYGNSLLTTHVMAGGSLVVENSFLFPNLVLDRMEQEDVTGFSGVPTTFAILLNRSNIRSRRFPHLRYVTQAGGAMAPPLALELSRILPGTRIFIMYGQTEATARLSYLDPSDLVRKAGSIGKAIPGVRITLVTEGGGTAAAGEVGEIVAEGENISSGYWNNSGETARAIRGGRLHTGDLARMDDEGYLYIVGRKSEMIKSGAHRISPKEIEEVILELPQVHEVAVIGLEDELLGETIAAFIVIKENQVVGEEEVLRHCAEILPPYKIPRRMTFLGELPKTESGKVRRSELRSSVFPATQGGLRIPQTSQ